METERRLNKEVVVIVHCVLLYVSMVNVPACSTVQYSQSSRIEG